MTHVAHGLQMIKRDRETTATVIPAGEGMVNLCQLA